MNSDTDSISTLQEDETEVNTLGDIDTIDDEDKEPIIKSKIILPVHLEYDNYYTNTKKTSPFLTKFEKTKLIGIRAQMISKGSEPLVNVPSYMTNSINIAELEYEKKCIPLFIKRYITDTEYEIWRPEDMINI